MPLRISTAHDEAARDHRCVGRRPRRPRFRRRTTGPPPLRWWRGGHRGRRTRAGQRVVTVTVGLVRTRIQPPWLGVLLASGLSRSSGSSPASGGNRLRPRVGRTRTGALALAHRKAATADGDYDDELGSAATGPPFHSLSKVFRCGRKYGYLICVIGFDSSGSYLKLF